LADLWLRCSLEGKAAYREIGPVFMGWNDDEQDH
jgi:hypothetical protein